MTALTSYEETLPYMRGGPLSTGPYEGPKEEERRRPYLAHDSPYSNGFGDAYYHLNANRSRFNNPATRSYYDYNEIYGGGASATVVKDVDENLYGQLQDEARAQKLQDAVERAQSPALRPESYEGEIDYYASGTYDAPSVWTSYYAGGGYSGTLTEEESDVLDTINRILDVRHQADPKIEEFEKAAEAAEDKNDYVTARKWSEKSEALDEELRRNVDDLYIELENKRGSAHASLAAALVSETLGAERELKRMKERPDVYGSGQIKKLEEEIKGRNLEGAVKQGIAEIKRKEEAQEGKRKEKSVKKAKSEEEKEAKQKKRQKEREKWVKKQEERRKKQEEEERKRKEEEEEQQRQQQQQQQQPSPSSFYLSDVPTLVVPNDSPPPEKEQEGGGEDDEEGTGI